MPERAARRDGRPAGFLRRCDGMALRQWLLDLVGDRSAAQRLAAAYVRGGPSDGCSGLPSVD